MSFGQPTLPGMAHLSAQKPLAQPEAPDPHSLEARLARKQANKSVGVTRNQAEMAGRKGYGPVGPRSKMTTASFGLSNRGNIPAWAGFHSSEPGARRIAGHVEEVSMVNMVNDHPNPDLKYLTDDTHGLHRVATPQTMVKTKRFEEARDDPSTRQSPRFFGKGVQELPHVFRHDNGDIGIIDGNHRITSGLAQGQMIHQARVITKKDYDKVVSHTERIHQARRRASDKSDSRQMAKLGVFWSGGRGRPRISDFNDAFNQSSGRGSGVDWSG